MKRQVRPYSLAPFDLFWNSNEMATKSFISRYENNIISEKKFHFFLSPTPFLYFLIFFSFLPRASYIIFLFRSFSPKQRKISFSFPFILFSLLENEVIIHAFFPLKFRLCINFFNLTESRRRGNCVFLFPASASAPSAGHNVVLQRKISLRPHIDDTSAVRQCCANL